MFKKIVLGLFMCANLFAYTVINDRDGDTLNINPDGSLPLDSVAYSLRTAWSPICSTRTTAVLDIYMVVGGTISEVTCDVATDSATFTVTGGLDPGTTFWPFNDTDKDTLGEAITHFNAMTVANGIGLGIVMVLRQGAYSGNLSSSMTVTGSVNLFSSTATTAFHTDAIIGMTYTIPATASKSNYITNLVANATFGSGSAFVNIYDGTSATDTLLRREKIVTTAVDENLFFGYTVDSYVFGSTNTATRIDVVNESGVVISAGQINILGFVK